MTESQKFYVRLSHSDHLTDRGLTDLGLTGLSERLRDLGVKRFPPHIFRLFDRYRS
jgi:hypothetical protein